MLQIQGTSTAWLYCAGLQSPHSSIHNEQNTVREGWKGQWRMENEMFNCSCRCFNPNSIFLSKEFCFIEMSMAYISLNFNLAPWVPTDLLLVHPELLYEASQDMKALELHMSCSQASADFAFVPNAVGTPRAIAPGWGLESGDKSGVASISSPHGLLLLQALKRFKCSSVISQRNEHVWVPLNEVTPFSQIS